jgi:hypothetical protein
MVLVLMKLSLLLVHHGVGKRVGTIVYRKLGLLNGVVVHKEMVIHSRIVLILSLKSHRDHPKVRIRLFGLRSSVLLLRRLHDRGLVLLLPKKLKGRQLSTRHVHERLLDKRLKSHVHLWLFHSSLKVLLLRRVFLFNDWILWGVVVGSWIEHQSCVSYIQRRLGLLETSLIANGGVVLLLIHVLL